MERKLAAILSADVKGYSRLMGEDEEATVRTLTAYRRVIVEAVDRHHGRVVDTPGDNVLADFASVVDAVRCAVEIQADLAARNAELPPPRRMEFRIGINLGDVLVDGPRIYGDGVNVAARLEGLAEAGGIALSGAAFEQVERKVPLGVEDGGEHLVKNIARPVRVYHVRRGPAAPAPLPAPRRPPPVRRSLLAGATILAVVLLAGATVLWLRRPPSPVAPAVAPASFDTGKPSLVVLPFASLGGQGQYQYLGDGITNDLITDLSRIPGLLVIASNTSFTYRGQAVDVVRVGRELNVRYVLEGSVQVAGERVRVNAQLADAGTGRQLWAERYDRAAGELLGLQSEIIGTIVNRLAPTIADVERRRLLRRQTQSPQAYDAVLRGWQNLDRRTRTDTREARRLFEVAAREDPEYAAAYVGMALTHIWDLFFGWTEHPGRSLHLAEDLAARALSADGTSAAAHRTLGLVRERQGRFADAIREYRAALAIDPNDAQSHERMGTTLLYSGRSAEAVEWLEAGRRLDPGSWGGETMHLGMALFLTGRRTRAIALLERAAAEQPDFTGHHVVLAAAYAREGRLDEARREAGTVRRQAPFFALGQYGSQFQDPASREALVAALRLAGLE